MGLVLSRKLGIERDMIQSLRTLETTVISGSLCVLKLGQNVINLICNEKVQR